MLECFESRFQPFDAGFRILFNSYYNGVGDKYPRPKRGLISRPSLKQVLAYRRQVDARVLDVISSAGAADRAGLAQRFELGLPPEQQYPAYLSLLSVAKQRK